MSKVVTEASPDLKSRTQFSHIRAVAEPRLELEGPGLTLGPQYIDLKLELVQA
jgi:hypothetical protein